MDNVMIGCCHALSNSLTDRVHSLLSGEVDVVSETTMYPPGGVQKICSTTT